MNPSEKAERLDRLRACDESACEALVQRYSGRMLSVARRLLRSEEDSADAVQDAFLSAFRSLPSFAGQASLGTWLHRIVVNSCLMKLRSQSRRRDIPIEHLWPAFDESGLAALSVRRGADNACTTIAREETRDQVRTCIDQLPEVYRSVLLLRDIEERDTDETAERLGISATAVKTRLHRARQALRALLEPIVRREDGAAEPDYRPRARHCSSAELGRR